MSGKPITNFKPVGACIYCGARDSRLTDEHIVPYALNGTWVLPASSCDSCAQVTSKFELTVARSMYGTLRIKRGFRSRRKRPESVSAIQFENGIQSKIDLPLKDLPTSYLTLELPPPGILVNAPRSTLNPEMRVNFKLDSKEMEETVRKYGIQSLELREVMQWGPLCRMIAKIAHSYMVACVGLDGYDALLPEIILGRSDELSYFVGGVSGELPSGDLWLNMVTVEEEIFLVVGMVLLGRGRLPAYQAVAGLVADPVAVMRAFAERS